MRDRDDASHGIAKANKRAVNILRIACWAAALVLAQIVQSLDARAHVRCARINELQNYNNPAIAALIERHYETRDIFVGNLSNDFMSFAWGLRIADIQPASIVWFK